MNRAIEATPVVAENGFDEKATRWIDMHEHFLAEAKEKEPEVLFIGDSIIERLVATDIWRKQFAFLHSLNFGIGGDQTQNVLWRLQNGELDYVSPKVVVLHVGTNNVVDSAEHVAAGIQRCVQVISKKQPQAQIVVLKLLPKGHRPNPYRENNEKINSLLPDLVADIPRTQLVNIDAGFIQADGTISPFDMFDFLHLTLQAYERAFEPVYDLLIQLLAE